ncbi:MAG: peroxide stress protein YaaA [Planctomycetota bacterium]
MLILLSPAKRLDFGPLDRDLETTKPELLALARKLAALGKSLSEADLKKLMSISDNLAAEVQGYFQSWKQIADPAGAKPAVFAFRGDVYLGLEAETLTPKQLDWTQDHVRILSGLYGVLRPLDLIQPYRLEMGSQLAGDHGKNLYEYWGDTIQKTLRKTLADQADPLVVNLASQEYAVAARLEGLKARVVTPVFKDKAKTGKGYRVISFFAKKARGMMARHLAQTAKKGASAVRDFQAAGYRYDAGQSSEDRPTFLRDAPA